MSFVHLHNHTHFSILSALAKPDEYIALAKEFDMPAVAITDTGVMYGAVEFYKKAKKAGVKPIIGMDAFLAPMGRENKTPENRGAAIVLLARNNDGYQNLLKLASISSLEGFYYRPRIDDELLEKYGSGLIALSAGLNGIVAKHILENDMPEAKKQIEKYQKIFGQENFFLELQHHPEVANWSIVNKKLLELSKETGAPTVAANACRYAKVEDAEVHDVLICVQSQKTVKDEHRFKYVGNYSFRSTEDMTEAFSFSEESIANTLKIAEMCNIELEFGENKIPFFDTGDKTPEEYLRKLCEEGMKERYGETPSEETLERLEFELKTVHEMGFDAYFLIVHDFVDYSKKQGIVVGPGRGSAAGSIIAYCLKITELDPLKYGLLFERFLNPERVSMPDIDIDFADTRRDEVLTYVSEKYGNDHVAQIITFGTLAPKAAIRDAGRSLGYTYAEVDKVAKTVPDAVLGKYAPLSETIKEDPEFSKLYKSDEGAREILDIAKRMEGTIRQVGTHACAVIISRDPLVEHTALQLASGNKEGIVTQYSMKPCESLGLLKMDFLGLKNLSIMETTLNILKRTRPEVEVDFDKIGMKDEESYKLLQRGDTTGVFQLESPGMKRYLRDLKPTEFGDIIAMVSLYRPGPMQFISRYIDGKHGKQKVKYLHDSLKGILEKTYGIAIYQEQILEIAKQFAGFSLGEADLLRRAIGKKIAAELTAQREKFINGAVNLGHKKTLAIKMFEEVVEPFAGYGFNKSHAACYAMISYQTAYLKAHFPSEFMAALLTADADNTERVVIEIEECRHLGIEVLPPDINESLAHFTVVDEKTIRFGLTAIKGIGEGPVREIIEARGEEKFKNLEELTKRVPAKTLNKKTIQALAYSGAMDSLGKRRQLAESFDEISKYAKSAQASALDGQTDIFGMMDEDEAPSLNLKKVEDATTREKLTWEKEFMGLYISGHPLQGLRRYFSSRGKLIGSFKSTMLNRRVKISGLVSQYRRVMTKAGKYMCFGEIEDQSARVSFVLFPRTYDACGEMLALDSIVSFEGKIDKRGGQYQVIVDQVKPISLDHMIDKAKRTGQFDEEEKIIGVPTLELEEEEEEETEKKDTEKGNDLGGKDAAGESEVTKSGNKTDRGSANGGSPGGAIADDVFIIKLAANSDPTILHKLKPLLEAKKGKTPVEIHIPVGESLKRVKVPFGVNVDKELKEQVKEFTIPQS